MSSSWWVIACFLFGTFFSVQAFHPNLSLLSPNLASSCNHVHRFGALIRLNLDVLQSGIRVSVFACLFFAHSPINARGRRISKSYDNSRFLIIFMSPHPCSPTSSSCFIHELPSRASPPLRHVQIQASRSGFHSRSTVSCTSGRSGCRLLIASTSCVMLTTLFILLFSSFSRLTSLFLSMLLQLLLDVSRRGILRTSAV